MFNYNLAIALGENQAKPCFTWLLKKRIFHLLCFCLSIKLILTSGEVLLKPCYSVSLQICFFRTDNGLTSLHLAVENNLPVIVDAVCLRGANMNIPFSNGDCALWVALTTGSV